MRQVYRDTGYQEVKGPQILDKSLWEKTGHWENYRENMFTTESEKREYALKPMNCPGPRADLQVAACAATASCRSATASSASAIATSRAARCTGSCACAASRRTTATSSAPRTRSSTSASPTRRSCRRSIADFGFTDIIYKVATRPENRVGSDDLWDKAEYALMEALRRSGCEFVIAPGDGAFYGPKIEYTLKDALGRQWQCGTMQVDFNTAERLGGEYVTETSGRALPVMLHRAIVGSFERFIGILIEHHAGALPAWLAPVQASVLNITESSGRLRPGSGQNAAKTRT